MTKMCGNPRTNRGSLCTHSMRREVWQSQAKGCDCPTPVPVLPGHGASPASHTSPWPPPAAAGLPLAPAPGVQQSCHGVTCAMSALVPGDHSCGSAVGRALQPGQQGTPEACGAECWEAKGTLTSQGQALLAVPKALQWVSKTVEKINLL